MKAKTEAPLSPLQLALLASQTEPNRLPSPGFILWSLNNDWQREVTKALRPHQLSLAQWLLLFTLVRLTEKQGRVRLVALVDELSLNPTFVSDVIKALVKKHFVHKLKLASDQRAFYIRPTAVGRITVIEAYSDLIQAEKRFFSRFAPGVES